MKIGYIFFDGQEPSLDAQNYILFKNNCDKFYKDTNSNRPELKNLLEKLEEEDCLVVMQLDRLAKSINGLIPLVLKIKKKGASIISLEDNIDTTKDLANAFFLTFEAFRRIQKKKITQRTRKGLDAARARGRQGGRPKGFGDKIKNKIPLVVKLRKEGYTVKQICDQTGIAHNTLYRILRDQGMMEK